MMKQPSEILRKASPEDVECLVALMAQFYAEGGYSLNQQSAAAAFVALLSDDRLGHVWFMQADSEDVGHVVVTLCFSMEYGGVVGFVDDLFMANWTALGQPLEFSPGLYVFSNLEATDSSQRFYRVRSP